MTKSIGETRPWMGVVPFCIGCGVDPAKLWCWVNKSTIGTKSVQIHWQGSEKTDKNIAHEKKIFEANVECFFHLADGLTEWVFDFILFLTGEKWLLALQCWSALLWMSHTSNQYLFNFILFICHIYLQRILKPSILSIWPETEHRKKKSEQLQNVFTANLYYSILKKRGWKWNSPPTLRLRETVPPYLVTNLPPQHHDLCSPPSTDCVCQ